MRLPHWLVARASMMIFGHLALKGLRAAAKQKLPRRCAAWRSMHGAGQPFSVVRRACTGRGARSGGGPPRFAAAALLRKPLRRRPTHRAARGPPSPLRGEG